MIVKENIERAYQRIKSVINKTPLVTSDKLNKMLGHEIIFKAEGLQVTGAFKVRGVLNCFYSLEENNNLPTKFVAYSSGNHAKALAWVGSNIAKLPTEIYMHKSASTSKREAIKSLGANLVITEARKEAETLAKSVGAQDGNYFLHPSDNDFVLEGAATLTYEALEELSFIPDAIFATCGGGALLSGVFLANRAFGNGSKIFAVEPSIANDAAMSYRAGKITGFDESPLTMADGARTLKVSERTFNYLKRLDGFMEVTEDEIFYWSVWLHELLSVPCEPTAATAMAGAFKWLKKQQSRKKILVILSGGNIDSEVADLFKVSDHLHHMPSMGE